MGLAELGQIQITCTLYLQMFLQYSPDRPISFRERGQTQPKGAFSSCIAAAEF